MGLLDILSGGQEKAARRAGKLQAQAADQQKKEAARFKRETVKGIDRSEKRALTQLSEAEAQALKFRQQAGQHLTAAENRALAQYDAAERSALGQLQRGEGLSIGALDRGETGSLDAIQGGRTGAIDALTYGRDQGLGQIAGAENIARGDISGARDQSLGYFDPYYDQGTAALNEVAALQGLMGPAAQQAARERFVNDPSYQFIMSEAIGALDKSATARGGLYSGAAMKELQDRAANIASTDYANYYNRTAGLADMGYGTAGQMAGIESQAGRDLSGISERAGVNRASLHSDTAARLGDVELMSSGREADIMTGTGVNRANVYSDAAARGAGISADYGQLRGAMSGQMGVNRANTLMGSGDLAANMGARRSDVLTGLVQPRVNALGYGLQATNNAIGARGNALSASEIGQANARSQGLGNLFGALGTIAALPVGGAAAGAEAGSFGGNLLHKLFT